MPNEVQASQKNEQQKVEKHIETVNEVHSNQFEKQQQNTNAYIPENSELYRTEPLEQEVNASEIERFKASTTEVNIQNLNVNINEKRIADEVRFENLDTSTLIKQRSSVSGKKASSLLGKRKVAYQEGVKSLKEYLGMRERLLERQKLRKDILEEGEKQIEEKRLFSVYKDRIYPAFMDPDGQKLKEYLDANLREQITAIEERESAGIQEVSEDSFMNKAKKEALEMDQSEAMTNNVSVDYENNPQRIHANSDAIRKIDQWILSKAKGVRIEFVQELLALSLKERTVIYYLIEKKRRKSPNIDDINFAIESYEPNLDEFISKMTTTPFKFWRYVPGVSRMYWNKLTDGILAVKRLKLAVDKNRDIAVSNKKQQIQKAEKTDDDFFEVIDKAEQNVGDLSQVTGAYEDIRTLGLENIFEVNPKTNEYDKFSGSGAYEDFTDDITITKGGLAVINYFGFIRNGGITRMGEKELSLGSNAEAVGEFVSKTLNLSKAVLEGLIELAKQFQKLSRKYASVAKILENHRVANVIKEISNWNVETLVTIGNYATGLSAAVDLFKTVRDFFRKRRFNKASEIINRRFESLNKNEKKESAKERVKRKYAQKLTEHTKRVKNTQMVEHGLSLTASTCKVTSIFVAATGVGAIFSIAGFATGFAASKATMYFMKRGDMRLAIDHFLGIREKYEEILRRGKKIDIDVLRRGVMAKLGFTKLKNFYSHIAGLYAKFILDRAGEELASEAKENDRPYIELIGSLGLNNKNGVLPSVKGLTKALLG